MSDKLDNVLFVQKLAEVLGEHDPVALRTLHGIFKTLGAKRCVLLAEQTKQIEAAGGLMVDMGGGDVRRRTPGGVFFYLAKQVVPADARREIWPTHHQRRKAARQQAAA